MSELNSKDNDKKEIISQKKPVRLDWRVEMARIPSIIAVVIVHILLHSEWIGNTTMPYNLFLYVAMAVFMFSSGYVRGLKKEFNTPGTPNISTYGKFVENRFIRLYIGYFLALGSVFLARVLAYYIIKKPIDVTPISIILDLTDTWNLFQPVGCGGIWPPGWFICAIFLVSLIYPFLRKLKSINKIYIYIIIGITLFFRILVALSPNPNPAYFFPFSWITEFSIGMMIGEWVNTTGGPPENTRKYQKVIIKLGSRVWAMYLCHIVPIIFISYHAQFWECVIIFIVMFPLTELYYRLLKFIYKKVKK